MIPFKGTKWKYLSSETTSFPPELESEKNSNYSNSMDSKIKAGRIAVKSSESHFKKKADKMVVVESSDLMNVLEKFSDVWNDCPTIDNPILKTENSYNEKRRSYNVNSVPENNVIKKESYAPLETDQPNSHSEERKMTKRNESERLKNQSNRTYLNVLGNNSRISSNDGKYDAKKADLKRKKAILEQQQLHVDQKNIIKQALSSLDSSNKVNKKIVFDNDEEDAQEEIELEETSVNAKRQKLFDDDDNVNSQFDIDVDFKLNHKFEGKKGQKLLELQSKFASDSRFTLDKRFYDIGSDGENDKDEPTEEPSTSDEKTKQLAILESIVKQQVRPLSERGRKSGTRFDEKLLLRFDPTREDHAKYVINQQESSKNQETENKTKKVKKKEAQKNNSETIKPEVSKEKFVSVKENLKEVLTKDSGFSLLSLFGSKEPATNDDLEEVTQKVKKPKHASRNPFKYDSSDSETEEDAEVEKEKGTKLNIESHSQVSWRTNFFFSENDLRFQEAFEFLKCPEEEQNNNKYAGKRKLLKDFIRNKYKNTIRKNSSFKKKLGGGLKKKPYKKKINKKS